MASPVNSVQRHTITIPAPTKTDVTDLTFTVDAGNTVTMTGTGLPAMVAGDEFVVMLHASHNGGYIVNTVNTSGASYLVESIDGAVTTAAPEDADIVQNNPVSVALTGTPASDTSDCIPFVTTEVTALGEDDDAFSAYNVRASFIGTSPNKKVQVKTAPRLILNRALVCEVTVVEFNSTEVNVYQGELAVPDSTNPATAPIGAVADETKAFLYFTHTTHNSAAWWRRHNIRGLLTESVPATSGYDTVSFERSSNNNDDGIINWYVAEASGTAWDVDPVTIQLADTVTTNLCTAFTAVDMSKACVFGSYMGSQAAPDANGNEENTIDVKLDSTTQVRATRKDAQTGDGVIDWAGFVVEFTGNENVYRGTLTTTAASPDPAGHTAIGATVNLDGAMVHTAGQPGTLGSGAHTDSSDGNDVPGAFCGWRFFSTTQIDCRHDTTGAQTGGSVSWEVIEWDTGGAPPAAARRVMVR